MKVCYVLSYYSPNYIRTQALIHALKKIEFITLHEARNKNQGIVRYFQTFLQLLTVRFLHNPEVYVLGFRGYEIYWLVRLITFGKVLIYDHFMSPHDSLVNELKRVKSGGVLDKLLFNYEKGILRNASLILTDTFGHQELFIQQFEIPQEKILVIPVSTNEELFTPGTLQLKDPETESTFKILFYSTILPLHGVDIILEAASLLEKHPIHFTLILGRLKNNEGLLKDLEAKLIQLENVSHKSWVNYSELPQWIIDADLCLGGPFGNTGQGKRVITTKTFQFLAMGKPVVVGQIDYSYGFVHQHNCLLVRQGDPDELAETILWAYHHPKELVEVGNNGREMYLENFSNQVISQQLETILRQAQN